MVIVWMFSVRVITKLYHVSMVHHTNMRALAANTFQRRDFFLLSACEVPVLPGGNIQSTGNVQPTKGGTWIDDLYSDPDSLIPNGSSKRAAAIVDQAIYAPLFYGDASGAIHPGLAKEVPTVA